MWSDVDGAAYDSAMTRLKGHMERVKKSFGRMFFNEGRVNQVDANLPYEIDYKRRFYLFDIIPMGAIRMTQSDKWKLDPNHANAEKRQRIPVTKYFAYKTALIAQANMMNYEVGQFLDILFLIPMPESWSEKKKKRMNGLPCDVKPDTDNLVKGFKDALCKNDSYVWKEHAEKRWSFMGSIIVFE